MVEVIAHGRSFPRFDKSLGGPPAQSRQRLGSIPGHRLLLASCPLSHPADDLKHLAETDLCPCAAATIGSFRANLTNAAER